MHLQMGIVETLLQLFFCLKVADDILYEKTQNNFQFPFPLPLSNGLQKLVKVIEQLLVLFVYLVNPNGELFFPGHFHDIASFYISHVTLS